MSQPKFEKASWAVRQEMGADQQRPTYHFLPPSNWINDPHGLIEWNGRYHLFYQYNPNGPFHDSIHWGHADSDDLVHWRDLPIALAPEPGSYDKDGCWTGYMVSENGLPTILYTAAYPQTVAAAVSHDDLITWQKLAENPLIDGPPEELRPFAGGHFRDPFIWRTEDGWEMVVVSKIEGKGGQVLLYSSCDLRQWQYQGVFLSGDSSQNDPFWQGTMWECPNFLDFGDRQVLLVSVQSTPSEHLYTVYFTGTRVENAFMPQFSAILVHGGSFYAPQVWCLASNSRLLMSGWLSEERSQQACQEAGWSGSLSVPMTLELLDDGALAISPAEELRALRSDHWQKDQILLLGKDEVALPEIRGKALEIQAEFTHNGASDFGLKVLCSPDGIEQTRIIYDYDSDQILVEREQASLDQRVEVNPATMPVGLEPGQPLRIQLFVDHSIIELFVNGRLCLTCRVYPRRHDSDGVCFFSRRGHIEVNNINIWKMKAIWPTNP